MSCEMCNDVLTVVIGRVYVRTGSLPGSRAPPQVSEDGGKESRDATLPNHQRDVRRRPRNGCEHLIKGIKTALEPYRHLYDRANVWW